MYISMTETASNWRKDAEEVKISHQHDIVYRISRLLALRPIALTMGKCSVRPTHTPLTLPSVLARLAEP
jgi:hypothetical protein